MIESFLHDSGTLVDVRSPSEFKKGHIPEAINIPILNDEDRAAVGLCYKEQGQSAAVELGFELAGPRFAHFIKEARKREQPLKIYCWRGGLRSKTMSWILETTGVQTVLLDKGYKAFRNWVLTVLKKPRNIHLLGGLTGSGKTEQLHILAEHGEQVLDLEALAKHRGSSFGTIGMSTQPTCEQFENELAIRWNGYSFNKPVWIEDESRMIGHCKIPDALFDQMAKARFFWLDSPKEKRLNRLMKEYGRAPTEQLVMATMRLHKKLGSERTNRAVKLLQEGNIRQAFDLLLDYYDSAYTHNLQRRNLTQQENLMTLNSFDR